MRKRNGKRRSSDSGGRRDSWGGVSEIILPILLAATVAAPAGFYAAKLQMPSKEEYLELKRVKLDSGHHETLREEYENTKQHTEKHIGDIARIESKLDSLHSSTQLLMSTTFSMSSFPRSEPRESKNPVARTGMSSKWNE